MTTKLPVEIGSMVAGKYRVERVLGQGGMGVVVSATHDELDHRVAIKFLSSESAKGAEWVTRFSREAKTAAKIKNEHAVKVFDVGKLETGVPFMVMEYLDGRNLDEILEELHKLPLDEAAECILQACEALAEAHLIGIVHRDLKPANLFVTHRNDGTMCVKILDFGISKVDESVLIGGSVTHTTALVGSPLYMSPERLRGAKDVDRRADIWSLGVMLQEMVTGAPPFVADTIPEIHALVLTSVPTPLHRGYPNPPPALEAIIQKCLEKTPEARYQNVLEFAQALAAIAPASQGSVERISRITVGGSGPKSRVSLNPGSSGSFPPPPSMPNPRLAVTAAVEEMADDARSSRVPPSSESLSTVSRTGRLTGALTTSMAKIVALVAIPVVALGTFVMMRKYLQVPARPATQTAVYVAPSAAPSAPITAATTAAATVTATTADEPETPLPAPTESTNANAMKSVVRHGGRHAHSASAASASSATSAASAAPSQDVIDYGGRN